MDHPTASENCSTCVINETNAPPMSPVNTVERAAAPIPKSQVVQAMTTAIRRDMGAEGPRLDSESL